MKESSTTSGEEIKEYSDEDRWMFELREEIDKTIQRVYAMRRDDDYPQREMDLIYTKLQEARMWTNKILEWKGVDLMRADKA